MSSFSDYFENSSIFKSVLFYLNALQIYVHDSFVVLREPDQLTSDLTNFSEFQCTLLKVFSGILGFNLLIIFIAWKYYGLDIYQRFIKPTSIHEIEELKASVSKLALPKEHTPRI